MFLLKQPSSAVIERFLRESQDQPLSYGPIGLIDDAPRDFDTDETVVAIGSGRDDYQRAVAALHSWKQFDLGWVQLFPSHAATEPGSVVAVLIRHCGFWSLNGGRVVYKVSGAGAETRWGFAYGTLGNHAEAGEELFEVTLSPRTGQVMYRIRAASRPRAPLARIGYPIVRMLQARFRRHSAAAMKRAVLQVD